MNKITNDQIRQIALADGLEYAELKAFLTVESGNDGFDPKTGKLVIQFEKSWFKKTAADWKKDTKNTVWQADIVGNQRQEWTSFNSAFASHPVPAMLSTSIGLPQIMGFHYKTLGYTTVGAMWDDFKKGEFQQVCALVRFIKANPALYRALKKKDWHTVASIYNGAQYAEMAVIWGREPYNISMEKAYLKFAA